MIVDPDFFDHWKTLVLVEELEGDPAAPLYVLRLWAHCQNRRQSHFTALSDRALKALCRYPGHPKKLVSALSVSGYISMSPNGDLVVNGWDEYNARLLANWENGKKGGRPPNGEKPIKNPPETQSKPTGNPTETHQEPIRVDRSRVDKNKNTHTHPHARGFENEWDRWLEYREASDGKVNDIQAEAVLMDLCRRGPDKAARDIDFSIRKGAKSILDSDHDFQQRAGASNRGSGRKKPTFEELGL